MGVEMIFLFRGKKCLLVACSTALLDSVAQPVKKTSFLRGHGYAVTGLKIRQQMQATPGAGTSDVQQAIGLVAGLVGLQLPYKLIVLVSVPTPRREGSRHSSRNWTRNSQAAG